MCHGLEIKGASVSSSSPWNELAIPNLRFWAMKSYLGNAAIYSK